MSELILVRHGQATPFEQDTDRLSPLGEQQAHALGEFLADLRPTHVLHGPLVRQRKTAEIAGQGRGWPTPITEPRLAEFDGDGLMRTLAPLLARQAGAALRALLELGAKEVAVLRGGTEVRIPVEELSVGDEFVVRPGEKVATDGVVVDGAWAAGDCAAVPDLTSDDPAATCAPTAQHAVRQARAEAEFVAIAQPGERILFLQAFIAVTVMSTLPIAAVLVERLDMVPVECVARAITAQVPTRIAWEVQTFESKDVNAFALPGGKIGVYTGLLKVASSQDQLAAVIGHEVAHVLAGHSASRVSNGIATQFGMQIFSATTRN